MYKSCTWLVKKPRAEGSTAGIAVKTKPAKHDAAGIAPSFDTIETFPVGNGAQGLTFDGTNIWCANLLDDTVIKLRASDGVIEGTFPVGGQPRQRDSLLSQSSLSCECVSLWVKPSATRRSKAIQLDWNLDELTT